LALMAFLLVSGGGRCGCLTNITLRLPELACKELLGKVGNRALWPGS
jgi:hypothetical protein